MKRLILCICLLVLFFTMKAQHQLSVRVSGIEEISGKVAFMLCDESGEEHSTYWIAVEADSLDFDISDLPAGSYGIKFFHDADNSGDMNTNWIGIPKEGFGFSNDAKLKLGPPDLEDILFQVAGDTSIQMTTRYL